MKKIQINVSDFMLERIDNIANLLGISRSALCNCFITHGLIVLEREYYMEITLNKTKE